MPLKSTIHQDLAYIYWLRSYFMMRYGLRGPLLRGCRAKGYATEGVMTRQNAVLALFNTNQRDKRGAIANDASSTIRIIIIALNKVSRQFRCLIDIPRMRLALGCSALRLG
jgi:hypothetical protein